MHIIGLTGSIATGKSTVTQYLRDNQYPVIDADLISKKMLEQNTSAYKQVVAFFGDQILDKKKEIDRKQLSNIIFENEEKRVVLNNIMHPLIIEAIKNKIQEYFQNGEDLIFIDAPLLIETGLHSLVDEVILLTASRENKINRIINRDYISEEKAKKILDTQLDDVDKIKYASFVVENNEGKTQLIEKIKKILEKY